MHISIYLVTMTQLLVEMDEKIHKQFKMITIKENTTMAAVVRTHIDAYIAEKTKPVVY